MLSRLEQAHGRSPNGMSSYRSLESSELEIVLAAVGVLVLVSVLGCLLLVGVGLKPPQRDHDTEHCEGYPAKVITLSGNHDDQSGTQYHDDEDEAFFDRIRRRSHSIAEEFRQELINMSRAFSLAGSTSAEQSSNTPGVASKIRRLSLDSTIFSWKKPNPEVVCSQNCDFEHSPVSATGREDEAIELRERSFPGRSKAKYDLEAQESKESLI